MDPDTEPAPDPAQPKQCWCVIKHPVNDAERAQINEALEYARSIGDSTGTLLAVAQLTGHCPART